MFDSKTPSNIEDIAVSDIYNLVEATEGLPSPKVRLNLVRLIFKVMGYDLSPDLTLALIAEPKAQLILATAGGGKTTAAQLKVILEKIIRHSKTNPQNKLSGEKVLCLVYNKHNVKPMEDKHKSLIAKLKAAGISGLDIDNTINACTMHSFCDQWRREYVAKIGLMNFTLISDAQQVTLLDMITKKVLQKFGILDREVDTNSVLALYNFAKESMKSISELTENDKFIDLDLPVNVVEEIFEMYEKMKQNKRKYDFTDMLYCVYNLLKSNPAILERVQRFYDYIVADEVQDFTPIMMNILQLLVSDGTPLLCIGDEDQSIYNFRGADIYNTLNFSEKFDGGEVYLLSRNRRCSKAILDLARDVIKNNTLRFNKSLNGVKDGGRVDLIPYNSVYGENASVVDSIRKLNEEQLYDSVVCYRERESSLILVEMLEEARIPFYVIGGYHPLEFELYNHVIQVLDLLESPIDSFNILQIYKILPIRKSEVYDALKYDPAKKSFSSSHEKQHFSKYDYGNAMNSKGFIQVMERLVLISKNIDRAPMNTYFEEVYNYLCKYFWKLKKNMIGINETIMKYIEDKVFNTFNVNKTYREVYEDFSRRKEFCKRNQNNREGLAISTFHGLKGLEFDNVYIIDMDNEIFPNYPLIDSRNYSENTSLSLKECETRLFYVAVTRAKTNLIINYSKSNPSKYVLDILNETNESNDANKEVGSSLSILDAFSEDFDSEFDKMFSVTDKESITELDNFEDIDFTVNEDCTPVKALSDFSEPIAKTEDILRSGSSSRFKAKSLLEVL